MNNPVRMGSLVLALAAVALIVAALIAATTTVSIGYRGNINCGSWVSPSHDDSRHEDGVSRLLGREGTTADSCAEARSGRVPTVAILGGLALISAIGAGFLYVGSSRKPTSE